VTNIRSMKNFYKNYFKRVWIFVPNITFLRFRTSFIVLFLISLSHAYAKWLNLDDTRDRMYLIQLFFTVLVPNVISLLVVFSAFRIMNKKYPRNNIPARVLVAIFALVGGARANLEDLLQHNLEPDEKFNVGVTLWGFPIVLDLGDLFNGVLVGITISVCLIFYALFIASELRVRHEIYMTNEKLKLEINQAEDDVQTFLDEAEESLYRKVLAKIEIKPLVEEMKKKELNSDLEKFLSFTLANKLRAASTSLIKKDKHQIGLKTLDNIRFYINGSKFTLKPVWFAACNVLITYGNNISTNMPLSNFTLANSILCGSLLFLINCCILERLIKIYSNFYILVVITSSLALSSEVLGYFMNNSLPLVIRVQRFVFFFFLLATISFINNLLHANINFEATQQNTSELREKYSYLEAVLNQSTREIAEHLHGYLIFRLSEIATRYRGKSVSEVEIEALEKEIKESFSYENYSLLSRNFVLDESALGRIVKDWSELMEIKFTGDLDRIALVPEIQKRETWNVIIELINNAYRHGEASKINFKLDLLDQRFLLLTAINNGLHVPDNSTKGTGSSIIAIASDGNWTIQNEKPSGVRVEVKIELYDTEKKGLTKQWKIERKKARVRGGNRRLVNG